DKIDNSAVPAAYAPQKTRDELSSEVIRLQDELVNKEQTVKKLNDIVQQKDESKSSGKKLQQTPVIEVEGVTILPRSGDTIRIAVNDSVLFYPNTTQLLPSAENVITKVLNEIRVNYPDNKIGIEGHTDPLSENPKEPMQEIDLSLRKASSVAVYLLDQKKIDPKLMHLAGVGTAQPLGPSQTAEGRAKNNRVEFVIYP
ncbi:MAG: OmpA/MotB family protein, partial [Thermoguttaceae bacterium]